MWYVFMFTIKIVYTCVWEKAYAKVMGSFIALNYEKDSNALRVLTGFESLVFPIEIFDYFSLCFLKKN